MSNKNLQKINCNFLFYKKDTRKNRVEIEKIKNTNGIS